MNIFDRFYDKVDVMKKQVTYGQVIILLGLRGKGKSETIKNLCNTISGKKYVISLDKDLSPIPTNDGDKREYNKLSGCKVIEKEKDIRWESGVYILEDFPILTGNANTELYNKIKTARHFGMNFIIVAHDYKVLKNTVFNHANAILIYQDPVITPHQLKPKVGGLGNGYAILRAVKDLQQYHYIFISFDHKKWHNPSLDSRDVGILKKTIRGNLQSSKLSDINYPKKAKTSTKSKNNTRKKLIEILLKEGLTPNQIASGLNTTPDYIWKEKVYIKKVYIAEHGKQNLPSYLKDGRRKP